MTIELVKSLTMDKEEIVSIYENLPPLRKEVLNRILLGYSTREIADGLFNSKTDPVACVAAHLKEIYKNYKMFLEKADPESKRSHLIILFHSEAPSLIARLKIKLGDPLRFGKKPKQFGDISGEYKFALQRVYREEIPILQAQGRKYFNAQDHLPTRLLESWHDKDPNSFRKIQNKNGRPVGFFIILFPKLKAIEEFSKGILIERELKSPLLLSSQEAQRHQENYAYISVVVGEESAAITNISIILLLAKYLDCIRSYRKIDRLYATAATDSGHDLMSSLGFHLHTPAFERRDGEDFLESDLTSINMNIFEYLVQTFPAFKRHSSGLNFKDENDWKPMR
jgi:hypothetical protein